LLIELVFRVSNAFAKSPDVVIERATFHKPAPDLSLNSLTWVVEIPFLFIIGVKISGSEAFTSAVGAASVDLPFSFLCFYRLIIALPASTASAILWQIN